MINYAHRGASAYAPENTMAAFELGLSQRANGIETDVQCTSDGVLVLHHGKTLRRIAGLEERVCDLTLARLQSLDFGRWFDARFAGERIVTLEAFWARYAGQPVHLALELKQPGIEARFLEAIAGYDPARLVVTAFDLDALKTVRRLDAGIPLGYLTEEIAPEVLAELKAWGIGQICPRICA
ncbi:MAG TPA: glycerophosphodiester phosphodiesterase family protein, partial [Clostridia bacterium]|nr:glycerophosphodiester phosphodiesterase family protein [Clostridia bacterium]